jgi:hypothetical protein
MHFRTGGNGARRYRRLERRRTGHGPLSAGRRNPRPSARDSLAGQRLGTLGGREYGVLFQAPLPGTHRPNDVVELVVDATALDDAGLGVEAVIELRSVVDDRDSLLVYRSTSALDCARRVGERGPVVVAIPLSRALSRHPGLLLRAYVWNRHSGMVRVHGLRLRWREGDPALYGLVEPLHGHWRFAPQ